MFCPSTNKNEIHRIYTIFTYSVENQYDTLSDTLRRNKRMVMYNKIIHISGYKWAGIAALEDITYLNISIMHRDAVDILVLF